LGVLLLGRLMSPMKVSSSEVFPPFVTADKSVFIIYDHVGAAQ
jgi:hypothetical protein